MAKTKSIHAFSFVIIILFIIASCRTTIDISEYPSPSFSETSYSIDKDVEFSLSIIETGFSKTPEAFVFRGGKLFKSRKLSHVAVLIQHPQGNFTIDAGLGSAFDAQYHDHFSFIERRMFNFTKLESLKATLLDNNFSPDSIDFILPTHLHFDHASGIEDFPNAQVWTTKEEYTYAVSEEAEAPSFIKEQYDAEFIKWKFIEFHNTQYEIFDRSYDVFSDGTVVLVPLSGHTKGSIGIFVNLNSGKRYFFTGDLTWAAEGFLRPSEKSSIPRNRVDGEREKVNDLIVKIHHLSKEKPEIILIPAHDFNAQQDIAPFPEMEF